MDFSSFKLTECGTSAQTRVAEGRRTENGIHVEYYISTQKWDNGSRDYHEFRRIVRAFDGDDILYRDLIQGPLVQEPHKGLHNGLLGLETGQKKPPFPPGACLFLDIVPYNAKKRKGQKKGGDP